MVAIQSELYYNTFLMCYCNLTVGRMATIRLLGYEFNEMMGYQLYDSVETRRRYCNTNYMTRLKRAEDIAIVQASADAQLTDGLFTVAHVGQLLLTMTVVLRLAMC